MASSEWYFMIGGQQFGPVPPSHLRELAASGRLKPTDWVWRPGLPSWVPAGKVRGIFPTKSGEKSPERPTGTATVERPSHVESTADRSASLEPAQSAAPEVRQAGEGTLYPAQAVAGTAEVQSPGDYALAPSTEGATAAVSVAPTGTAAGGDVASLPEAPAGGFPPQVVAFPPGSGVAGLAPGATLPASTEYRGPLAPVVWGEASAPHKPIAAQRWISEALDSFSGPMPYLFLAGAITGWMMLAGALIVALLRVQRAWAVVTVAGLIACVGLAGLAWPLALALARVASLARSIYVPAVPALGAIVAAGAVWTIGLAYLLLCASLADLWNDWTMLVAGFLGFVLAQFTAGSILTASPRWEPRGNFRLAEASTTPSRLRGTLMGWAGRVVGQLVPVVAGTSSLVGALMIAYAVFQLVGGGVPPSYSVGRGEEPTIVSPPWEYRMPPGVEANFERVRRGIVGFTTLFSGMGHLLFAYVAVAFAAVVVPLCHLGWDLGRKAPAER